VIILIGGSNIFLEAGVDVYRELGAVSSDTLDGNLTFAVSIQNGLPISPAVGDFTVAYTVSDAAGNIAVASRKVSIRDTGAPLLTLSGPSMLQVRVDSNFNEPGYSAYDVFEGNLTDAVIVTGAYFNTSMVGANFTVFSSVNDSSGNIMTMNRTVVIVHEASSSGAFLSPMTTIIVAAAACISLTVLIVIFVIRRQRNQKRESHITASIQGLKSDFLHFLPDSSF
jgi:hypothetical protein